MKKTIICLVIVTVVLLSGQIGLAKEKSTAQDWLQKGIALQLKGVYGEAIKMYTEAIKVDPKNGEAYFNRGKSHRAYHPTYYSEAMDDFDRTIDLEPENAEAYYQRGLLHAFMIKIENARSDMQIAANLGHPEAKKWLAPEPVAKEKVQEVPPVQAVVETQQKPAVREAKAVEGPTFPIGEYLASKKEPVIHFDINRSDIKSQDYPVLDEIAVLFKEKLPEAAIVVAGHTDSSGSESYNDSLSVQRAQAVESYLKNKYAFPDERFVVKGYGEKVPVATNANKKGQAKNRRVEIMGAGQR